MEPDTPESKNGTDTPECAPSSGTFRPPQDGFLTAMRVQAGARGRAAALAATGGGGNTTIDAARAVEIFLAKRRHKKRYGVQQLNN